MNPKEIAEKAEAMLEESKDFRAVSKLLERYRYLLINSDFCEEVGEWVLCHDLAKQTPIIGREIQKFARALDPTCKVGKINGTYDEVYKSSEELLGVPGLQNPEIVDTKGPQTDHIKVVWVRFGDIIVHFWFQAEGEVSPESYYAHVQFDVHVFARTGKENKILYARGTAYWEPIGGYVVDPTQFYVGQVGDINPQLKNYAAVLGTALALTLPDQDEDRDEHDIRPISHCIANDDLCVLKDIVAALEKCGKSVASAVVKESSEPSVMKVLPS